MLHRCLLYVDGKKESDLAKKICNQRRVDYSLIDLRKYNSHDINTPRLVTDFGRFEGLAEIMEYAETFGTEKVS